jgi:trk system potassium uptake protein TrkA
MNVIIVGGGKVGAYLAELLLSGNHQVRVIEIRGEKFDTLQRDLPGEVAIHGSGTDPNVLEIACIQQAQVVAAVTGSDEANLVVASLARFEFNVPRIIARVNNPKNTWLFTPDMGVDVALNQADLMAHLIAEEMSLGDMTTLLKLRKGQYSLVEEKIHPGAAAAGKAIRNLNLPSECVITAVIRQGQLIIPRGDTILYSGDEVLAVVHSSQAEQLASLLGKSDTNPSH